VSDPGEVTGRLCTRCGLCCDGTLFADVELAGAAEAGRMAAMGLIVEDDDPGERLLVQPCALLRGRRCGIYGHRPVCCRTVECRLLRETQRGRRSVQCALATVASARARIRRAQTLLARMGPRDARLPLVERAAEALARAVPAGARGRSARAELEATMEALERILRREFLPDTRGRGALANGRARAGVASRRAGGPPAPGRGRDCASPGRPAD